MNIWLLSDLHLESTPLEIPLVVPTDADVCIVAGDVRRNIVDVVGWLSETITPHVPTIYVPGNHCYWKSSIIEGLADGRAAAAGVPGLHLLSDDVCVIGDTRFVGSTLWTDYGLFGGDLRSLAIDRCKSTMNDHKKISFRKKPQWQRFTTKDAATLHATSRKFIERTLAEDHDGPTVVVTHHAPHRNSMDPEYIDDLVSSAYVSDLTDIIETYSPELWVHGHIHKSFDYEIANTRVRTNARGHAQENENPLFDPALIVRVEKRTPEPGYRS